MFLNMLQDQSPHPKSLTDGEIVDLIDALDGIAVDFNVGGLRVPGAGKNNPIVTNVACDQVGSDTATRDFPLLARWVERGGTIDSLTTDHAVSTFAMEFYAHGYFECIPADSSNPNAEPTSTEDYPFWAKQLAIYMEDMQKKFYDRCDGTESPMNTDSCQDLDFGTWEAVTGFEVTEPGGGTIWRGPALAECTAPPAPERGPDYCIHELGNCIQSEARLHGGLFRARPPRPG
ncbi:MAG: hypothetical protein AAGM22_22115 [Acidobacteriota bacterium]